MVTVGAQTKAFGGNNASLTLNGNIYAIARTWKLDSGNKQTPYPVVGTDIPIMITEEFEGTFSIAAIFSSDGTAPNDYYYSLFVPVNGQIPPVNFVLVAKDTAVSPVTKTYTWTGVLWPEKVTIDGTGPQPLVTTMTGKFTGRPVIS